MSGFVLQTTADAGAGYPGGPCALNLQRGRFSDYAPAGAEWQDLSAGLERLGNEELTKRGENVRRILREQGVTCFVQAGRSGRDEPWQLDLLPVVIGSEEWSELETGILQRAALLNLLLTDLYGKQRLLRDGFVPAPLVFANPTYLRPCQGIGVKDNVYLMSYCADLARSTDGRWWVIADRTQGPVGLGFALQNRSVLSRALPEVMGDLEPRPLHEFLRVRRDALRCFSPASTDNPSIVLLTPGPRNEAYFEHAYLSRLLGLTLAEGDDLTVRERRVSVKTLNGLRPVDVVLRRVNDRFCDPLELRGDSLLGVPGLLEAARAGNVNVCNAVGTGLMESPAFMPFLPGLCRYLLGEDLRLPSLATWWCGQAHEQAYVREHLRELVIRPAFEPAGAIRVHNTGDEAAESALLERLQRDPHEFIGQERINLARVPVHTTQGISSAPFVIRVFVLHNGNQFTVMPGGLARVVEADCDGVPPVPLVGLSKDLWVLPDRARGLQQWLTWSTSALRVEGGSSNVPSRAAENLFWLGRYSERLEQIVRASRYALGCLAEGAGVFLEERLGPLQTMLSDLGLLAEANTQATREGLTRELFALVYADESPNGARALLNRIHLAAFSVRDRLSTDTWHLLNRLRTHTQAGLQGLPGLEVAGILDGLLLDLIAFSGMEMENMTRGHGWVFLDMGRRIERGIFMSNLMESISRSGPAVEWLVEPALEIADSVMTHRRRYFAEPQLSTVAEVLVYDLSNPRSLAFQVASLKSHAALLPAGQNPEGVAALKKWVWQIDVNLADPGSSAISDGVLAGETSPEILKEIAYWLAEFSEMLNEVYFSHVASRVS